MRQDLIERMLIIRDLKIAFKESLLKLSPKYIFRSPIIGIIWIIAVVTLIASIFEAFSDAYLLKDPLWFAVSISLSIWFVLIFANFGESLAELKGRKHIEKIHNFKEELDARLLSSGNIIPASKLAAGDIIRVNAGELIPCDGEVIKGIASVDESAITGESAPLIRESSSNKNFVMARTRVLSDFLVIRVNGTREGNFLSKMLDMVDATTRCESDTEKAVNFFLLGLTIIYIFMCFNIIPVAAYLGQNVSIITICSLLICVMPTTAAALSAPVAISAVYKLFKIKILAINSKAIDVAGDIDVLMIDKTGTITSGNRLAHDIIAAEGVDIQELIEAVGIASYDDDTIEGRSILNYLYSKYGFKVDAEVMKGFKKKPFSAKSKMSGVDHVGAKYRKGAVEAVSQYLTKKKVIIPIEIKQVAQSIGNSGGTPMFVIMNDRLLGLVHLKDTVRAGIANRIARIQAMGIRVVLVTGDNYYTTQTIANEVGIEEFICEADPERKIYHVKDFQSQGLVVAVIGDGVNDAPALSQAEIGYTLNSSSKICREAANIIDLENDPMKLIDLVELGRETLATRGCLTTFSLVSDIAKYFVIIPAIFTPLYPQLQSLNFMGLYNPHTAILSAAIFNSLIIIACMPLSMIGIKYKPIQTTKLVKRYFTIFGIIGIIVPFIGIKLIDLFLGFLVA